MLQHNLNRDVVATWKLGSRHQLAKAMLKMCCDMIIDVATYMFEECTKYCRDKGNSVAIELSCRKKEDSHNKNTLSQLKEEGAQDL